MLGPDPIPAPQGIICVPPCRVCHVLSGMGSQPRPFLHLHHLQRPPNPTPKPATAFAVCSAPVINDWHLSKKD